MAKRLFPEVPIAGIVSGGKVNTSLILENGYEFKVKTKDVPQGLSSLSKEEVGRLRDLLTISVIDRIEMEHPESFLL